jgi:hypothetical protein
MIATIDKAIDNGRVGLSKSLMTTPCERKGFYGETVRDADGKRLRFAMPEKVHFGSAVDSAHLEIVYAASQGKEPDLDLAIEKGMERARQRVCRPSRSTGRCSRSSYATP